MMYTRLTGRCFFFKKMWIQEKLYFQKHKKLSQEPIEFMAASWYTAQTRLYKIEGCGLRFTKSGTRGMVGLG